MPEGDTIHKLAAALTGHLVGEVLQEIRIGARFLASAGTLSGRHPLSGQRVDRVYAVGKHLFIAAGGDWLLRSHLGMHGSWHHYPPGQTWQRPARQASLVLGTAREVLVCFNARELVLVRAGRGTAPGLEARVGPDLLAPGVAAPNLAARSRELLAPGTPLVDVLLEQRIAGGIGNVYKSELLYLAGLHPLATLAGTSDAALGALYRNASALLQRNLGRGPRVTRREVDGGGALWVYGRGGAPCLRCGEPVRRARLGRGLRVTYWCPRCQPSPGPP